jgi:hypothetical protein
MAAAIHSTKRYAFERSCASCDTEFATNIKLKAFCSEPCRRKGERERQSANRAPRECTNCGHNFRPRGSDRTKFCSRDCSFDFTRKRKVAVAEAAVSFRVLRNKCRTCDARFEGGGLYCSLECKPRSYYVARPKITRQCEGCGVEITGTAAKRECTKCQRRKFRHLRKPKKRADHYGVEHEPIDPLKVLERDGWRCQVCGVKTPKRFRGTPKPNAPEVDHRIPLAMGGGHTWDNVQCCCRSCNLEKGGTKARGQLSLFSCVAA